MALPQRPAAQVDGWLLVCLDHRTQAVHVLGEGTAACTLSHLEHGLAAQYTSASFLGQPFTRA